MAVNVPLVAVKDLSEQTNPADTDCFIIGTTDVKKIKLSTLASLLKKRHGIEDINTNIKNLQTSLDSKQSSLKDTGWIDISTFYNGCTHYNTSNNTSKARVRQYGPIVNIQGIIKTTKELTLSGTKQVDVFKLPDSIDPPAAWGLNYLQQGSGANKFVLTVGKTDGRVVAIQRYGTTSNGNVPNNAWLNVTCTYLAS
jgi:hypothetical protein